MPAEGSPVSGSLRVLSVDITPERVDDAAEALRELVGRLPEHPGLLPVIDVRVDDGRLGIVTPSVSGDALDKALELYGPAAVDDALPRLRQLAGALDRAAHAGLYHGALHPRDILVSSDETWLAGVGIAGVLTRAGVEVPLDLRYTAPEVAASRTGSAAGDQFSLAVIAHEWMFSGAVTPADGFLAVPPLDGIDVRAMQRAFDTATETDPASRFIDCLGLATALEGGVGASLEIVWPEEESKELPVARETGFAGGPSRVFSDLTAAPAPRQFGVFALVGTLIVGMVIGAAGMRLAGGPAARLTEQTPQDSVDSPTAPPTTAAPGPTEVVDIPIAPPRDEVTAARPGVAPAGQKDAGLLIHSTPAGATVTIDGLARGTTPLAVRGLQLGTRRVTLTSSGYQPADRQVTLTDERPSRTLDVNLVPVARGSAPRAPASPTKTTTAAATGSLVVDSRPAGALVTIDGRPAGNTPLTLTGLAPGRRTVRIEQAGYRPVTTTVDVKAGERARVGARLEGGTDEE